jgi:hypothetical protein
MSSVVNSEGRRPQRIMDDLADLCDSHTANIATEPAGSALLASEFFTYEDAPDAATAAINMPRLREILVEGRFERTWSRSRGSGAEILIEVDGVLVVRQDSAKVGGSPRPRRDASGIGLFACAWRGWYGGTRALVRKS